ncbi:Sortase family protein [Asanoa hainanensis]|uniref:Sortase family protein n=1 Tax=Asanoa hainanensis TaxID=560556 RepID=A0A239P029_9ACTN|nr:class F sortase [Asanoa hainanensis]SNT60497.1 Sortase family protein [Asanoa hainanensis]
MARWPKFTTGQTGGRHEKLWRAAGAVLVAVTALAGAGLLGASFSETPVPPQPAAADAMFDPAVPAPTGSPTGSPSGSPTAPVALARSEPASIHISRIGVKAKIMSLGLNKDGTLQVPPLKKADLAGWYSLGASPGEIGNAVVVGHVTTKDNTAVFFRLGELRKDDKIMIKRKDGSMANFVVDGVKAYPKKKFPTALVYGPNQRAGLRLVTCGGNFDAKASNYLDNVIVFATAA